MISPVGTCWRAGPQRNCGLLEHTRLPSMNCRRPAPSRGDRSEQGVDVEESGAVLTGHGAAKQRARGRARARVQGRW
jgi:hypothetical protein